VQDSLTAVGSRAAAEACERLYDVVQAYRRDVCVRLSVATTLHQLCYHTCLAVGAASPSPSSSHAAPPPPPPPPLFAADPVSSPDLLTLLSPLALSPFVSAAAVASTVALCEACFRMPPPMSVDAAE
jgi:hypothetical protein